MKLSTDEKRFLARRAGLTKAWPYVGVVLLVVMIGFGGWLYISKPLLGNPFFVMQQIKTDSIPSSSMSLMAVMLPVVFQMCILIVIVVVLFAFSAFSNEKKYLDIIAQLRRESVSSGEKAGQESIKELD